MPRFLFGLPVCFLSLVSCSSESGNPSEPAPAVLTTIEVSISPVNALVVGGSAVATAQGRDQNGAPISLGTITWSTGSASIVQIDGSGRITVTGVGATSISATAGSITGQAGFRGLAAPVSSHFATCGALPEPGSGCGEVWTTITQTSTGTSVVARVRNLEGQVAGRNPGALGSPIVRIGFSSATETLIGTPATLQLSMEPENGSTPVSSGAVASMWQAGSCQEGPNLPGVCIIPDGVSANAGVFGCVLGTGFGGRTEGYKTCSAGGVVQSLRFDFNVLGFWWNASAITIAYSYVNNSLPVGSHFRACDPTRCSVITIP